jgi:alkanesulfonate monooxygenase SsuD/methylene tetrahydromethanopterin reductase-like flavin-dependent oxidoreductase (luciferase family)
MKFGLFQTVQWPEGSDQHRRYLDAIEQSVLADELGYDAVWMTEHHFTRHAITSDSLALVAHLAAKTSRIRLGTAVAVLPFHDPVRLAESAALVDHLTGGRLELVLRSWRAEEPFAFAGKYHRYDAAFPQPKPLQRPHPPIWHATNSDDGLRRCAERDWGIVLPQGTSLATVEQVIGRWRKHLEAAGRPYDPAKVLLARGMHCGATDEEAVDTYLAPYVAFLELAAKVSAPPPGQGAPRNPFQLDEPAALRQTIVCGSPRTCEASLRQLQDLGVENVIFFVNLGGLEHATVVRSLRRFAEEVMPRFR